MKIFILLIFVSSLSLIHAQQPYAAMTTRHCENPDNTTSQFGYTCNGLNKTCLSYLTFRSQSPYNNVYSISSLLGSNPSQISSLNSVLENAVSETDKLVLVPVTCSCSGNHYQHNITYGIQRLDTYPLIANNTFQGLSTCQAIKAQNNNLTLYIGAKVVVPLRCACPTKNQTDQGVNYLLSFLTTRGQHVFAISRMFGVHTSKTVEANSLSREYPTIYPFTTLLVPHENPPTLSQTLAPPPPPASPPPPPVSQPSSCSDVTWLYVVIGAVGVVIGAVGGGGFVLVVGIILFLVFVRKTKEEKSKPIFTSESFEAIDKLSYDHKLEMDSKEFMDSLSDIAKSLKVYTFEEINKATENFSPSCWIRGSVYRGKINGGFAAIKRMNGDVSEEINVLSKISHFNLIRLSGVCFNEGNWYLVYEYALNGPLSDWISNNDDKLLSFSQRVQIALDVATGLNYLHNYTSPPYVHKDLKSNNVLLDGCCRAKIANFGLARSAGGTEGDFALTRHIVGTKGYMAPEYIENGFISTKLDVYAFGVLVLELLTGKDVSLLYDEVNTNLNEILYQVINVENGNEKLRKFMDNYLRGNYPEEMAIFMACLVGNCMEKDPSARPGMDEIVHTLSRIFNSSLNWEMSNTISWY